MPHSLSAVCNIDSHSQSLLFPSPPFELSEVRCGKLARRQIHLKHQREIQRFHDKRQKALGVLEDYKLRSAGKAKLLPKTDSVTGSLLLLVGFYIWAVENYAVTVLRRTF